jgi:hypothetical protein
LDSAATFLLTGPHPSSPTVERFYSIMLANIDRISSFSIEEDLQHLAKLINLEFQTL